MNPDLPQPEWAPQKPYESLLDAARWLHTQAVDTFLADKTHVHLLFLFSCDNGLISVNPLPPGVTDEQMLGGVRQAVRQHDLYAVITIAETWTYFSSGSRDHTLVQIMHNEMRVSDLRDEDKAECLMVRMECREGEGFAWINKIARAGDDITLGSTITFPLDKTLKQDRFFER